RADEARPAGRRRRRNQALSGLGGRPFPGFPAEGRFLSFFRKEIMSEQQTAEATIVNDGAKKAPATFRAILGEKIGMTQIFHPKDQNLYDVTIVKAGPCPILRVKTADST